MAKTRSCRRTKEEQEQHAQAVAIRKMTDKQLCEEMERREKKAYKKGFQDGKNEGAKDRLPLFMSLLESTPGIGPSTIKKLEVVEKSITETDPA